MQIKKLWIPVLSASLLMTGCVTQQSAPVVKTVKPVKKTKPKPKKRYVPAKPKKDIELKKVEDENFSSDYMYPQTNKKVKKEEKAVVATDSAAAAPMSDAECISMIGQAKFDKYSEMFGNAGALKKCKMLKAL